MKRLGRIAASVLVLAVIFAMLLSTGASAAVPDRTWFYYNMEHEQAAENKNLLDLVAKIASSDEPIDVFTMPEHPQFADYKE